MDSKDKALFKFQTGYNCCQSVLYTFAHQCKISTNFAIKLGTAFGAGMGRTQEVCGAVTGSFMVLSMLFGRNEEEDKSKQEIVYAKVQEFTKQFTIKNKSVRCIELLDSCNLRTDEGQKRFEDEKMINKCCKYIQDSVEILTELSKE